MEASNGFSVPTPCSVSWNGMQAGKEGRFCSQCSQTVIDFSEKTGQEIVSFLVLNSRKRICGRFRNDQVIEKQTFFPKSPPLWMLAVAICYAFGESLFEMNKHVLTQTALRIERREMKDDDGHTMGIALPPPQKLTFTYPKPGFSIPETDTRDSAGIIKVRKTGNAEVFTTADVMPVFPGGEQALLQYLKDRVRYPVAAMDTGIPGSVIARFIIQADGTVGDVSIARSGGTLFDAEVIRVVKTLPRFKPAILGGKPVAIYFFLPVYFNLK